MFHRLALKTTLMAWVVSLALLPLSGATYSDQEESSDNNFTSGAIDLTLESPTDNFEPAVLGLGDTATREAVFGGNNSNPMNYSQFFELAEGGNPDLCGAVQLKAYWQWYDLDGDLQQKLKYSGPLDDFVLNPTGLDPDLVLPDQTPYYDDPDNNPDYAAGQQWYSYELTLPNNTPAQLGNQTCAFDLVSQAWPVRHNLGPEVGFWDEERLSNSIESEVLAWVSGIKFNDENGNGNRDDGEAGIPNWTIYAAEKVEDFDVSANGTVATSQALTVDKKYLVRVQGTFTAGDSITADAQYSVRAPNTTWTDTVQNYESYGPTLLNLWVNGSSPDWGAYNDDHDYWLELTGDGSALNFYIFDIFYPNNAGHLDVTLYEVKSFDMTDSSGFYELDLSPFTHDAVIAEEQKDGWKQTKPDRKYYPVSVPGIWENRDFGNQEYDEPEDLNKIVINEVYYDVDTPEKGQEDRNGQLDEWVELYNPTDQTVNLKDWTLTDNSTTRTISHRNVWLPGHSYAVIAKAAQTWGYWTIPAGAVKIELGQNIGNGLANNDSENGDHLILKNAANQEVDYVAWDDDTERWGPPPEDDPLPPSASEGHSIARVVAGVDTDQPTDWHELETPNPGTNPHNQTLVAINQFEDNNLVIGIINADEIDAIQYSVKYTHEYAGVKIGEAIEGESIKFKDQAIFLLPLMYLGTCSPVEGIVCVPHENIGILDINLLYKSGPNIVESAQLQYTWQN